MINVPEGATTADPLWQRGYAEGEREEKPTSEDSIYISGWCHGYCEALQCSAAQAEHAYIDALYAGGL